LSDLEHRQLLSWIRVQRSNYKKGKLEQDRIDKLQSLGYSFDLKYYGFGVEKKEKGIVDSEANKRNIWENNYLKLINYKIAIGNCNVPRDYKKDISLANFVSRQRSNFRKGKLLEEQIKKLELLNFDWGSTKEVNYIEAWNSKYKQLLAIYETTGGSHVSKGYIDNSLYTWVLQQRGKKRKGVLTNEQIELLDKVSFNWNPENTGSTPDDDTWFEMFQQLEKYKDDYGDSNVSQLNKDYKRLGRWVNDQRLNYSKGKLLEHRKELLEELGFIWNIKDNEFDLKVKLLKDFYDKFGHFEVKQSNKEYGGLWHWLYKLIKIGATSERKMKLENVGYDTSKINTIDN
jgi:hypothetical protein